MVSQQLIEKTLNYDGNLREYTVYIPVSYNGNSSVPLLFNFHGGSGDIASQISTSDMRPISEMAEFILVYPQALPDPNGGGATSWTHKEPTSVDDIFFVEAMIEALALEYMIDTERVYACGYSNGGEFCYELACRLSNRIAAAGVVARSMYIETYNQCSPTHPTAIVTIHGSNDDYNGITFGGITYYISLDDVNSYWSDFNNTDPNPTIFQLPDINNSDGSTVEHYSWPNGDGCVSVEHYKVIGGGHDWPGSFGNMDIDASEVIWEYVSKYDINGLIECNSTSINEKENENGGISIYPNPVKNDLTVEMNTVDSQVYNVYSSVGKIVLNGIISSIENKIDLSGLPPNVYFLRIENRVFKILKIGM